MTYLWSILCSTGAFAPAGSEWQRILQYGPLLDADGLELLLQPGWCGESSAIIPVLSTSGLYFPVVHAEKSLSRGFGQPSPEARSQALDRFQKNCHFAYGVGANLIVLHLWELPESDDEIRLNLDALPHCLRIADQHGLELAIETIPCRRADPLQHIQQTIRRYPRCYVALDTEFLAVHDQVEAALTSAWLWRAKSVQHIHVKDYVDPQQAGSSGRRFPHPGEGSLNFPLIFARLHERDFSGSVSLEAAAWASDGTVDIPRLQRSLELLRQYRALQSSTPQAEQTPSGGTTMSSQ